MFSVKPQNFVSPTGTLPQQGVAADRLIQEMDQMTAGDARPVNAKNFSLIYNAGETHANLIGDVLKKWHRHNMLGEFGPFPSLKRFEADVLSMSARIFHAPGTDVYGDITSGGTESVLLAVKTARDWAREHHPEITNPEILMPETAHPSFQKGAELFGLTVKTVPVGPDKKADVAAMRRAVSSDTVMLVASAPCYPFGTVDPVTEIAQLASSRGILCHVDACLGGFLLPFVRRLGLPATPFDFSVPGVTSLSADIHKFGYGPRGSSLILYRDRALWEKQFFVATDWSGYLYMTRTLQGSRPGAVVMAAWAAMRHLGEEGYLRNAEAVMRTVHKFKAGVEAIEGLKIIGAPEAGIFSFASTDPSLDVYALSALMKEKGGWWIDPQQNPSSIHMTVSPAHSEVADAFMKDLKECVDELRAGRVTPSAEATINRFLGNYPDREFVKDLVADHMATLGRLKDGSSDAALAKILDHPVAKFILRFRIARLLLRWGFRFMNRIGS